MSKIVIRSLDTDEVVHEIDTSRRTEREVEKVERGLTMTFDFDRYYYEVSDD